VDDVAGIVVLVAAGVAAVNVAIATTVLAAVADAGDLSAATGYLAAHAAARLAVAASLAILSVTRRVLNLAYQLRYDTALTASISIWLILQLQNLAVNATNS
jgi:hypothetical protein